MKDTTLVSNTYQEFENNIDFNNDGFIILNFDIILQYTLLHVLQPCLGDFLTTIGLLSHIVHTIFGNE